VQIGSRASYRRARRSDARPDRDSPSLWLGCSGRGAVFRFRVVPSALTPSREGLFDHFIRANVERCL